MMQKNVYILWDSSHIWGLMALKAMRSFGLSCRLVKGIEIAQHGVLGKHDTAGQMLFLVPGGNARQKAAALGARGRAAIRDWLSGGGLYLGFCGGAGLALKQNKPEDGLNICPWQRANYRQRLYHLISGHVRARIDDNNVISMPVWWPGRFSADESAEVDVLARYLSPAEDFWLADLPLTRIPVHVAEFWRISRGIETTTGFPVNEPLVAAGKFGNGLYILSYAHLETPDSHDANIWLANLLGEYWQAGIACKAAAPWQTDWRSGPLSQTGFCDSSSFKEIMQKAHARSVELMNLACDLHIFFKRKPWLWGWQSGFPGMACNNIVAALAALGDIDEAKNPPPLWKQSKNIFIGMFNKFISEAQAYFWTYRLDTALAAMTPDARGKKNREWTNSIFGHPMLGGGLATELVSLLDEYIYQMQDGIFNNS